MLRPIGAGPPHPQVLANLVLQAGGGYFQLVSVNALSNCTDGRNRIFVTTQISSHSLERIRVLCQAKMKRLQANEAKLQHNHPATAQRYH